VHPEGEEDGPCGGPWGRKLEAGGWPRYLARARAATAIGAVKPASRETHPARKPASGWTVRDRK